MDIAQSSVLIHIEDQSRRNPLYDGLRRFFQMQKYTDVEIVLENGNLLKAHRLVLGLYSKRFESILDLNINRDTVHSRIFMGNVTPEMMSYILEFIYTGRVEMPANSINTFMKAARYLKIAGLNFDEDDATPDQPDPYVENRKGRIHFMPLLDPNLRTINGTVSSSWKAALPQ